MSVSEIILQVVKLLGGLALFLYGMNMMSDALEKRAGNQLKDILSKLTSSTFKGFILGLAVTAIIQSSSATTVMVVGFVNSGVMTLRQSVGVIMGANLGTSVTSWILSLTGIEGNAWYVTMFKPTTFVPLLVFIGILMFMFLKSSKKKDVGLILIGFSILMYGMDIMSTAVEPLAEMPEFQEVLIMFSNPILGVLVGTIFTAVIQSSSASVGILQALTLTGNVTYATAIPIIMGQNIGTCVSALISSFGATKNAKRAAVIHLSFNLISTIIILPAFYLINWIVQFPWFNEAISPLGVAVVHTLFKIIALALLMPFSKQLEKLSCIIIKDKDGKEELQLLDDRLLQTPAIAIERCKAVAVNMAELSVETLRRSINMFQNFSEKEADAIREAEEKVDSLEDMLGSYLVKLSSQSMAEQDSHEAAKLLHIIGDFERISDHATNLLESAEEIHDKKLKFSGKAQEDLKVIARAVDDVLTLALNAFKNDDLTSAANAEPLEEVIDHLKSTIKKRHIKRLQSGECTIELGFVLSDITTNLERISDHCSNIAICVIEINNESFDMHSYSQSVRHDNKNFADKYEEYKNTYALAKA